MMREPSYPRSVLNQALFPREGFLRLWRGEMGDIKFRDRNCTFSPLINIKSQNSEGDIWLLRRECSSRTTPEFTTGQMHVHDRPCARAPTDHFSCAYKTLKYYTYNYIFCTHIFVCFDSKSEKILYISVDCFLIPAIKKNIERFIALKTTRFLGIASFIISFIVVKILTLCIWFFFV